MDADYTFYVKSIKTHVRAFLPLNISAVSSVPGFQLPWVYCILSATVCIPAKCPLPLKKNPSALCLFWAPLPYTYMYVIITPESQKKIIQQKIMPKNPRFFIYICHAMTNIKKYYQLLAFLPYYTTTFLPMAFLVIADAIKYILYDKVG